MKQTLKQFMSENQITGFEVIGDLILSVISNEILYALDVDTSNIPGGTLVDNVTEFTVFGDELTINNLTVNINDLYVASNDSNIE